MANFLAHYRKAIATIVGLAIVLATQKFGTNEYITYAIALATALGVYSVPNVPIPPPNTRSATISVTNPPNGPGSMTSGI